MADQHMALYRKWRPLSFADVYGQDHITAALSTQVQGGKTSHAYLFTGTRGTGKTSCARILARAVNCQSPVGGNPCNTCEACRAALSESALDISEIDAASMSGVDNIREIREESFFAPTALKKRVYIIDEVHMLSPGAFNALLKTLEEPPEHVLFILATTELHKVPATILSRCQRYDFRRIPLEIIAERLMHLAQAEGSRITPEAADLLAAMGDGSMRDAISLLDRAMADSITRESVEAALGLAGQQSVRELLDAVVDGDGARALAIFTRSYMGGQDMVSLFDSLLSLMRDVYVIKATGDSRLLLGGGRELSHLNALAERCDAALLEFLVSCVSDLLRRLTRTAIRRTDGEMCLLRMCLRHSASPQGLPPTAIPAAAPAPPIAAQPQAAVAADDLPWEEDSPPASQAAPTAPKASPIKPEPPPAPQPGGSGQDQLKSLVAAVASQAGSAVRTYLSLASADCVDNVLHITVAEESLIFMEKPAVQDMLNSAAQGMGLAGVRISGPQASPPAGRSGGVSDILNRARGLGVEIKRQE